MRKEIKNGIKKVIAGVSVMTLIMGIGSISAAAEQAYQYTFYPPFEGCAYKSEAQKVSTNGAYVSPSGSSALTTYCLVTNTKNITVVSDYIKTDVSGKKTFTYKSGYGGKDQYYCLDAYPARTDFNKYEISGKWQA